MGHIARTANEIMEVAVRGNGDQDLIIAVDRQGGMRIVEPAGWTLAGLRGELGATAVYRVERRGTVVRVEGMAGGERCLLLGQAQSVRSWDLPGWPTFNPELPANRAALPPA